jgi:tRNA threonylcarbamoyladenosine biosynthesis protein TsaB
LTLWIFYLNWSKRIHDLKILAIETSTPEGSVAVSEDTKILSEIFIATDRTHSENLIMSIDQALKEAGVELSKIDCIAISRGPGSFTSLRISMTMAKTLAFTLDKPIVAVSSLLAFANAYSTATPEKILCPMLDARKKEVYSAVYRFYRDNLQNIVSESAYKPEDILRLCPDGALVFGRGAELYKDIIESSGKNLEIIPQAKPHASSVARLGYSHFLAGKLCDVKSLVPNYCRKSEVEILFGG